MVLAISPSTKALGFWSAVLATVFSIAYDFGQIAEWLGWLGSQGGPESSSTPLGFVVLLTPSLFLGSSFLVLVVCLHDLATPDRRIWSRTAIAFATAYAVLISLNYSVLLTFVAPRLATGRVVGIEPFLFTPFDSFLYSVDILGYSFMSVATLFAARVFTGDGLERRARRRAQRGSSPWWPSRLFAAALLSSSVASAQTTPASPTAARVEAAAPLEPAPRQFARRLTWSGMGLAGNQDGLTQLSLTFTWEERLGSLPLGLRLSPLGGWLRSNNADFARAGLGLALAWYPFSGPVLEGFSLAAGLSPELTRGAGATGQSLTAGAEVGYTAIWGSGFTLGVGLGLDKGWQGAQPWGGVSGATGARARLALSIGWAL